MVFECAGGLGKPPRRGYDRAMDEDPPPAVIWGQRPYRITRIAIAVGLVIGVAMLVLRFVDIATSLLRLL